MTKVTSGEFQREFGRYRTFAQREPVIITNHGNSNPRSGWSYAMPICGGTRSGQAAKRLKDRPCVIVHTLENEHRETEVYIAPITHASPTVTERAVEMPKTTKSRLRLDPQIS